MLTSRRTWIGATLVTLSLLTVFSTVRWSSTGYQQCAAETGRHYREEERVKGSPPVLFGPELRNSRIVFRCTALFLKEHETVVTALATVIIAAFTVVLGLFTVSLARSTRIAADAAKDGVDIARKGFIADQRPWIPYPDLKVVKGLSYADDGASFTISVEIKNTGRTPAMAVHVEDRHYAFGAAPRIDTYELATKAKASDWTGGLTLFKGDTITFDYHFRIERGDLDRLRSRGYPLRPVVVICIGYNFATEPHDRHVTVFDTELVQKGPDGFARPLSLDVEYGAAVLGLTSPIGGGFAD